MNYLIKNASSVFSPKQDCKDIRIHNGIIAELGQNLLPEQGEEIIDASDCVIYPGFVNTHHHIACKCSLPLLASNHARDHVFSREAWFL